MRLNTYLCNSDDTIFSLLMCQDNYVLCFCTFEFVIVYQIRTICCNVTMIANLATGSMV